MASISKRPNGQWRPRYRDAAGREHALHFDRKVDATRWLDSVTAAMETGTYVDPRASSCTLGEYANLARPAGAAEALDALALHRHRP